MRLDLNHDVMGVWFGSATIMDWDFGIGTIEYDLEG